MVFKNEDTFQNFVKNNQEDRFHKLYDRAVDLVSTEFGTTYPVIINSKKIITSKTMTRTSPTDKRIILGQISKGNSIHAKRAIQAASKAFEKWSSVDYKDRVNLFRRIASDMRRRKFELSAWLTLKKVKMNLSAGLHLKMVKIDTRQ